jgi:hypothetical protein
MPKRVALSLLRARAALCVKVRRELRRTIDFCSGAGR